MTEVADWVKTQRKTFTKWANSHLQKKRKPLLEDVSVEFETGINLMNLMNALYDIPIPKHNKNPKMRPHRLDNAELALRMLTEAQVRTNFLGPVHLVDHDLKMILGMIWAIILDYAIKGISVDELTAKEGLLQWVRKKTVGYKGVDPPGVSNFSKDWKNGLAFCALIHRHFPNLLDYSSLDAANNESNLELAFSVAESELGIPRLLDVEDLTTDRPDERSVMTYVSEYFHRFASQALKEDAAKKVGHFLNFTRSMIARQSEFEARAQALVEWYRERIEGFSQTLSSETPADAATAFSNFRAYLVSEKPPKEGERLDIEALYAEIQTELSVNDRRAYEPPAELTLEAIAEMANTLAESEKTWAVSVRRDKLKFVKKVDTTLPESVIAEFEESFDHFDGDRSGTLDKIEFKAALSTMGIPVSDDKLETLFVRVSEGSGSISKSQYVEHLKNLKSEKNNSEGVTASFATLSDGSPTITASQMAVHPLTGDDVEFLTSRMEEVGEGVYDYNAYVASSFS